MSHLLSSNSSSTHSFSIPSLQVKLTGVCCIQPIGECTGNHFLHCHIQYTLPNGQLYFTTGSARTHQHTCTQMHKSKGAVPLVMKSWHTQWWGQGRSWPAGRDGWLCHSPTPQAATSVPVQISAQSPPELPLHQSQTQQDELSSRLIHRVQRSKSLHTNWSNKSNKWVKDRDLMPSQPFRHIRLITTSNATS